MPQLIPPVDDVTAPDPDRLTDSEYCTKPGVTTFDADDQGLSPTELLVIAEHE